MLLVWKEVLFQGMIDDAKKSRDSIMFLPQNLQPMVAATGQAERDGSDVEVEKYNDDYDDEEVPLNREVTSREVLRCGHWFCWI